MTVMELYICNLNLDSGNNGSGRGTLNKRENTTKWYSFIYVI